MVKRIEDYALIGDCEIGGARWKRWVDRLVMLAALRFRRRLRRPARDADNGFWSVIAARTRRRRRRAGTSIILPSWRPSSRPPTASPVSSISCHFDPQGSCHLVRIVRGRRGKVRMRSEYAIRFDYGSIVPWVTRQADNSIRAVAGPDMAICAHRCRHEARGLGCIEPSSS